MKLNRNKDKIEIIKPKSKKKKMYEDNIRQKYEDNKKFIFPILMAIIGFIFLTNSNDVIIYSCYVTGALVAGFGIFKVISYLQIKQQLNIEDSNKLFIGIVTISIGILIIILASIIQTFLNLLIGSWLIVTGVAKIINLNNVNAKEKNFNLIEAIIYITTGLYSVLFQNIVLMIVGIWMIIGASIEIYNLFKN